MSCDICAMIETKDEFKLIYEDETCLAFLNEAPLINGQVMLMPKKHFTIVEQTPDEVFGHLMNIANIVSVVLFETTGSAGTNILINNGEDAGQIFPHLIINIIPRKENDSLKLGWEQKKASDESLKQNAELIKKYADKINLKEDPAKNKPVIQEKKETPKVVDAKKEETHKHDEPDYYIKQLERIP